jgi:uncharacterized protein (TIGR03083 family)
MTSAGPAPLPPATTATIGELVDAFEGTLRASLELVRSLPDAQWELPTDCPAWTVRDQVSHLIGVERYLLGEPRPEHELPALPHVRTDFDRFTELDVDVRRGRDPASLCEELAATLQARLAVLRAPTLSLDTPLPSPFGLRPAEWVLRLRTFDCWMHEQDIRSAVARPGGLDTPAAGLSVAWVRHSLPRVLATSAEAGSTPLLRLVVDGPHGFDTLLTLGADGRGIDLPATGPGTDGRAPDATVAMSTEAFMRRAGGRWSVARTDATVTGAGAGRRLAERFLAAMAITP